MGAANNAMSTLVCSASPAVVFTAIYSGLKDKSERMKAVLCTAAAKAIANANEPNSFMFFRQFLSEFFKVIAPNLYEASEMCRNAAAHAIHMLVRQAVSNHQMMA